MEKLPGSRNKRTEQQIFRGLPVAIEPRCCEHCPDAAIHTLNYPCPYAGGSIHHRGSDLRIDVLPCSLPLLKILMCEDNINCWIYKSIRKDEMYLYLSAEDAFDRLPDELLSSFGTPVFVLSMELTAKRKLARVDTGKVISALRQEGYFLQMPPDLKPNLYFGD